MALTAKQQAQYNQLISAGASPSAAMQAASQVPDTGGTIGNAVIPTQPQNGSQASVTPTPQPNVPQPQQVQQQPAQQTQDTQPQSQDSSQPQAPTTNLQPGSKGQDVSQLQQTLVSLGYLTPEQVATGQGIYGPQTTAAVAKLQKDLGVQAGSASGTYGPQTQQALAQKYQQLFQSKQGQQAPDQAGQAAQQIQTASAASQSTDPVFGAMASSLAPIMGALSQVLNNINNPVTTYSSLQDEYNQLSQQYNLPAMQSQMLNMQNVMNGTEDDIRDELSKAGGGATESQVLGMTAARNKVILKQYNALATNYNAAQTQVQNMMQYASQDQATQLQKQQVTASITESMASIEAQMMSMGMTMQNNARSADQFTIQQVGYQKFAQTLQGNPTLMAQKEQELGLAPGTFSDPIKLQELDSYKQQQLAISAENAKNAGTRTYIYAASQGIGLPGTTAPSSGTTFGSGNSSNFVIPPNSLTRPSWLDPNVPLSMNSQDMAQYLQGAKNAVVGGSAGVSPYGNNITIPNIGNYVVQPDGSYILGSALPQELSSPEGVQGLITSLSNPNPPTLNYSDIAAIMQNAPGSKYQPASTAFYREQRSARQLLGNFTSSPVYATVSQAPLPFARIEAARNGDNSVSDTELLDSYITLAKGQGQITEAQIAAITGASSVSDKLNIIKQKVAGAGALISSDQRKSLLALSGSVFDQYSSQYKNLYTQAINVLAKNHMEPAVWGVIPDFTTMITTGDTYAKNAE